MCPHSGAAQCQGQQSRPRKSPLPSSIQHVSRKVVAVSERPKTKPLRFKALQAGSTIFLALAISSFPANVDPAYSFGAYCNLIISICHHGLMIKKSDYQSRACGLLFSCSDIDESRASLRMLRVFDQAVVGYICLYTGQLCE